MVDWADCNKNVVAVLEGRESLIVQPEEVLRVIKEIDRILCKRERGCRNQC